jgi:hypothetical protein
MDQQKTISAIASMDQANSMIHILYIIFCMHVIEVHGVICSFYVHESYGVCSNGVSIIIW